MRFARVDNVIFNIDDLRCVILQPEQKQMVICYKNGESSNVTYTNLEAAKETYEFIAKSLTELR